MRNTSREVFVASLGAGVPANLFLEDSHWDIPLLKYSFLFITHYSFFAWCHHFEFGDWNHSWFRNLYFFFFIFLAWNLIYQEKLTKRECTSQHISFRKCAWMGEDVFEQAREPKKHEEVFRGVTSSLWLSAVGLYAFVSNLEKKMARSCKLTARDVGSLNMA